VKFSFDVLERTTKAGVFTKTNNIGKSKTVKILSKLDGRVKNLKPVFRMVAENFRELERITFEKRGIRTWKPLSKKYKKWKKKNYPGKPKMVLKGDLKRSLTQKGGKHIERIKRQSLEMGTSDKKGQWHQLGKGRLPVRKVINPRVKDRKEWINMIRSFIIEKLGFTRSKF